MDKKTIIGILIIAAILVIMPFYNKIVNPKAAEEQLLTQSETIEDTPALNQSYSDDPLDPSKNIDSLSTKNRKIFNNELSDTLTDSLTASLKDIYIKTNELEIIMSTRGADIVNLKLLNHIYANGENIQMVPQDLSMPNFDIDFFEGKTSYSASDIVFFTDKDTLILTDADTIGAITFNGTLPDGSKIQRRMEFYANGYLMRHNLFIENSGKNFDQYKLWWHRGLLPTEPKASTEIPMFKLTYMMSGDVEQEKFKKNKPIDVVSSGMADFVSTQSKYFTLIMAPDNAKADGAICKGDFRTKEYEEKEFQIPRIGIGLEFESTENIIKADHLIIASPADHKLLEQYGNGFENAIDLGWRWLLPITKLILWLFDNFYKIIPNYGIVILIFTLLMKILLLPLASKQIKSMKEMQRLQPKLKELQEQYRDNPEKLNKATMELYKKHNVNPLGGCLPMVVQMPIFFALYRALSLGFQFRQASFAFWLKDLSSPDPYYVLPIIMAVTMFVQQKMTVKDPKQKMMVYIFPVFFLFIFRNMPAGLVLYWTFFNILTVVHNAVQKHPEPIAHEE